MERPAEVTWFMELAKKWTGVEYEMTPIVKTYIEQLESENAALLAIRDALTEWVMQMPIAQLPSEWSIGGVVRSTDEE